MNSTFPSTALRCDDVAVQFPLLAPGKRWRLFKGKADRWHDALDGVTLSVPRGKIVGVIGRNGAGKSTLLRTLAGVYPLSRGTVVRLGPVSTLFELGGMGGWLITGRQYVRRWLRLYGVPKRLWQDVIDEVQEFSELGDRLDDRIFTYSAGMAARLYFSTATSVMNDIYLIDEVLSVGDEHFQAKCWKRIRDRVSRGVSGVLVTHDWAAILRLCEHTCQLAEGRIVAEGDSEKIICDYLQLADQLDPARPAYFAFDCPEDSRAVSRGRWRLDIPVEIIGYQPVSFDFSIEKLVQGHDWQILFFGGESVIGASPGRYLARIQVESLPLPAGEYRLNLFLVGFESESNDRKVTFDMRSWTTGNSLRLIVEGDSHEGLVIMPVSVES